MVGDNHAAAEPCGQNPACDHGLELRSQVHDLHIVKQGGATLHGNGVIALQENCQGLAAGPHGDLGMHLSLIHI